MAWLCISAQWAISTGELSFSTKNTSTSGCAYHFNASETPLLTHAATPMTQTISTAAGFQLNHVSYMWYTLVGTAICIVVSLITSYFTGPNRPADLNPNLLAPFVRKLIKAKATTTARAGKASINRGYGDESQL
jgi:sodium-coupled monocarboxylate transporter 8/12